MFGKIGMEIWLYSFLSVCVPKL